MNQLSAYHTLLAVHRAGRAEKPKYLSEKLKLNTPQTDHIIPERCQNTIAISNTKLTIIRGGFCFRGANLWNKMPMNIRNIEKYTSFKTKLKSWVKNEIPEKSKGQ